MKCFQKHNDLSKKLHSWEQRSLHCRQECFNSPYGLEYFAKYAENIPGDSTEMLADTAKETKVHIVGGTIPEISNGKLYNTCTVFGPDGKMLTKYRKIHLADIDIPGRMTFIESKVLSPGNQLKTFQAGPCKIGIGICYDLRFQQLAQLYEQQDCNLLIYPAVFNIGTGPSHWELLLRARALDHKMFVAGCNAARDDNSSYVAYGNSAVVSPWGTVVAKAGDEEEIVLADIDIDHVDEVRQQIPTRAQARNDIYKTELID
eukprot:gene10981-12144_t